MRILRAVSSLLHGIDQRRTLRVPELLMSIYTDVISVHGSGVWPGSLVRVLAPLDIGEQAVRTGLHRLAAAGRLSVSRVGRRSYYALAPAARAAVTAESGRLYERPREPAWDGRWTLVLAASAEAGRQLISRGYVRLQAHLYVHPLPEQALPEALLRDSGVILWEAECPPVGTRNLYHRLWGAWKIEVLAEDYRQLLRGARRVARVVRHRPPGTAACFQLRLLLIHEYRRIRMRDPGLPQRLMPARWSGAAVQQLIPELYQALSSGSLSYVRENLEFAKTDRSGPDPAYFKRFGGLRSRPRG